jgi:hypothetical protein
MSRFSTTQWPDRRLRVPSVLVTRITVIEGRGLAYSARDEDIHSVELPDEFFLRELMDLDVRDFSAFIQFQKEYGRLESQRHIDGIIPIEYEIGPSGTIPIPAPWLEQVQLQPWADYDHRTESYQQLGVVYEEALVLRDAVRVWLFLRDRMDFEELRESWESDIVPRPKSPEDAVSHLSEVLNFGLMPFSPWVRFEGIPLGVGEGWEEPFEGLFGAVCIQLFNALLEVVPVSKCANENCKRFFQKQRGRAQSPVDQRWTKGVEFCTAHCAQAHHARLLRQDKALVIRLAREGLTVSEIAERVHRQEATVQRWVAQPRRRRKPAGTGAK